VPLAEVERVIADLTMEPFLGVRSQIPSANGFYAWWIEDRNRSDAVPEIPAVLPKGVFVSQRLLYIGICPSRASLKSKRNLCDRLGRDHRGGNIGASTFRFSLAALLQKKLELQPKAGHGRARIIDELPLKNWIEQCCKCTIAQHIEPWTIEESVIRELNPPLNLSPGFHPFRAYVSDARRALEHACGCT
jgi:hypothetical protein